MITTKKPGAGIDSVRCHLKDSAGKLTSVSLTIYDATPEAARDLIVAAIENAESNGKQN